MDGFKVLLSLFLLLFFLSLSIVTFPLILL